MKAQCSAVVAVFAALMLVSTSMARAHVASWDTSLALKANDTTVSKGTVVNFTARLSSGKTKCIQNRRVNLLKDGVRVARIQTASRGRAVFGRIVRRSASWKVVFRRYRFGGYPHEHRCRATSSNVVDVVVKT